MATVTDETRLARVRANGLGGQSDTAGSPRRRRGRIAAGAAVMAVSGWLAVAVFASAGSRDEVLVVARPVDRFEQVERDDLRVVRVAADSRVGSVPADRMDDVVGRPASVPLVEGSLLHEDQVLHEDVVVGDGEAAVGAVLAEEDFPSTLAAGAEVEVVVRPPAGSTSGPLTLGAWVLAVEDAERAGTESRRVTLVVPARDVALVSAAASDDRVSVAVTGER